MRDGEQKQAAASQPRVVIVGAGFGGLEAAKAFDATHASFLAMLGVTGPLEVFEGNKGFMEAIAGPFELDWQQEHLEAVRD